MTHGPRRRRTTAAPRSGGFTLLEVLLAVTVFGLMAAAAYGGLDAMTRAAAAQEQAATRLSEVQLAMLRLERELRQAISSPLVNAQVAAHGLQGDEERLEFRFLAPRSAAAGFRTRWMRYRFEGGALLRIPTDIDRRRGAPSAHRLLGGVTRLDFTYLDARGRWQPRWDEAQVGLLPAAVRLDMDVEGLGRIQRLFELPGDRP